MGEYATNAFMKIFRKGCKVLFSESLIRELHKDYSTDEINDMLNLLFMSNILFKVDITREDYLEAKDLSEKRNLPFVDCLNAVQSRNHKSIMVSQDEHFTKNLSDIVKVIKPQDL